MSNGRPTDYFVLYTMDGDVKEEISTTKPSIIYEVLQGRGRDTLHLDVCSCDLIAETELVKSQTRFTIDEVDAMDKDHIKNLTKGLLSFDEIEDLKSWF